MEIVESLYSLLIPNGAANLIQFAIETRRDSQTQFYFPIDALPMHTQNLIKNSMYDFFPGVFKILSEPLIEQVKSIKKTGHLLLDSWEFFLFTFFSKISRIKGDSDNFFLPLSVTRMLPDYSNTEIIKDQLAANFDLYLFSKFFLYVFEEAKYFYDNDLHLFIQLVTEYFVNPVNTVQSVNRSLDLLNEEEIRRTKELGPQSSNGDFFLRSQNVPLIMTEDLDPTQLMFLHSAVIIIKDQWKSYLKFSVTDKSYSKYGGVAVTFMSGLYHWFKTLLSEKPVFVQNKLSYIGLIYLSVIMPEDIDSINAFDHFISYEVSAAPKKSTSIKSILFESIKSGYSRHPGKLYLIL